MDVTRRLRSIRRPHLPVLQRPGWLHRPSPDTIRRLSAAGLVLVLIYLVASSYTNTEKVKDLVEQSTVSQQLKDQQDLLKDQQESLDAQDVLIEDALVQIGGLQAQLEAAAVQNEALMNQLRSINVEPVVVVRPVVQAPTTTTVPPTTPTTVDKAPGRNKPKK